MGHFDQIGYTKHGVIVVARQEGSDGLSKMGDKHNVDLTDATLTLMSKRNLISLESHSATARSNVRNARLHSPMPIRDIAIET